MHKFRVGQNAIFINRNNSNVYFKEGSIVEIIYIYKHWYPLKYECKGVSTNGRVIYQIVPQECLEEIVTTLCLPEHSLYSKL